ncbi:alanine--tRNA ligase-related protein [Streptomyces indicus]|uniref:alanine--tRNA ligase n=1 Tax=Streptomyces indicus TaxID=417292 RepID=A0A1G9IHJ4_9ACTN|nr:alanine--tRNA ligase-related protein [Streptomyces indicus]SDL24394.1 tRNA synthetases class II (A) [Streptomyces indicus]
MHTPTTHTPPTTGQVVDTFTHFFQERGHRLITGSTLLPPPGDPVLFTTSGMHPLTPYLEGRPHPLGRRLVNVQRCLRTTDLDEVGDGTHLTVFQMLGSWSLGDYGGPQSLRWGYELLHEGFGIPRDRLHVTVFGGDGQVGVDGESLDTWHELGLPVELTGGDENWWSNGPTGPCGPDSEIFVWTGDCPPRGTPTTDPRWVEVWNHVMMRHRRHEDGNLTPLVQRNIDTGMGLERLVTVLQGVDSVYGTDLFEPWLRLVPPLWDLGDQESLRVVCDHLRSFTVIHGDGVRPSHTGRGYVPRRLIRRTLTTLWQDDPGRTLGDLPRELVEHIQTHFGLPVEPGPVLDVLRDEEHRFRRLLDRGRKVLSRYGGRQLTPEDYHYLHDTHGLPEELVDGIVREG